MPCELGAVDVLRLVILPSWLRRMEQGVCFGGSENYASTMCGSFWFNWSKEVVGLLFHELVVVFASVHSAESHTFTNLFARFYRALDDE